MGRPVACQEKWLFSLLSRDLSTQTCSDILPTSSTPKSQVRHHTYFTMMITMLSVLSMKDDHLRLHDIMQYIVILPRLCLEGLHLRPVDITIARLHHSVQRRLSGSKHYCSALRTAEMRMLPLSASGPVLLCTHSLTPDSKLQTQNHPNKLLVRLCRGRGRCTKSSGISCPLPNRNRSHDPPLRR